MAYRTPADVKKEFDAHPRRALVITTVVHESRAIKAHLTDPEIMVGEKGQLYEYGRFSDPAGEWLVVHAITPQGNSDASLVASKAWQEFGSFHAQMFVGVAGSLKEDIPIGSVVVGDYVYNGHSANVEDTETLARPHGLASARELLTAAQALIYSDEWRDMIRAPVGIELPNKADYPCAFPPLAAIKGIVSGEEVVAGGKSPRYAWIRSHFNDCGAVEMEGWGVMNAAHHENGSTAELLRALASPGTDVSAAPSSFVIERLQALLPHDAELIAAIAGKLVDAWRRELGDLRTGTAATAPQLTDLALTLHRLGGTSRQSGVALFEAMIEIDAYGARETLAEIDGRFGSAQAVARQRLPRQRRRGSRRRAA
jgi:nucleoside phosphorylase